MIVYEKRKKTFTSLKKLKDFLKRNKRKYIKKNVKKENVKNIKNNIENVLYKTLQTRINPYSSYVPFVQQQPQLIKQEPQKIIINNEGKEEPKKRLELMHDPELYTIQYNQLNYMSTNIMNKLKSNPYVNNILILGYINEDELKNIVETEIIKEGKKNKDYYINYESEKNIIKNVAEIMKNDIVIAIEKKRKQENILNKPEELEFKQENILNKPEELEFKQENILNKPKKKILSKKDKEEIMNKPKKIEFEQELKKRVEESKEEKLEKIEGQPILKNVKDNENKQQEKNINDKDSIFLEKLKYNVLEDPIKKIIDVMRGVNEYGAEDVKKNKKYLDKIQSLIRVLKPVKEKNEIKEELLDSTEYKEGEKEKIINLFEGLGGNGKTNKGIGLYTDEINEICKKLGLYNFNYFGSIGFDELRQMYENILKVKNNKYFMFIINTSNNVDDEENLKHWCGVYCDGLGLEYYDPLALNIRYQEFKQIGRPYINKIFDNTLKIKYNIVKNQSNISSYCGLYCIRFLMMRVNGIGYKEATEFEDIKQNEKDIKNFEKNLNYFTII